MKLHFSNVDFSSSSGPNTFAKRLADELTLRGYQIVDKDARYDIFLCFIEPGSMPRKNAKIIHRLDGIWFKPDQFETHNKGIKWAYNNADHVIWQSQFDKEMTVKHWSKPKKGSVIHNGIKTHEFNILNQDIIKIKNKFDRIFTCSASWHRQKRLKENILLYKQIRNDNDALFVLGKNPDYIVNESNVFYLGHLPHNICLQFYHISDWFIHLAWLDHCPNVVIEALSQNCPVICTESGGTKEVVGSNGIVIPETTPYNFELADYDNPYHLSLPQFRSNDFIFDKNDVLFNLGIEKVANKYIEVFNESLCVSAK